MSIRDDLYNRAVESAIGATLRAGRVRVIELLSAFGAQTVRSLSLDKLPEFIEKVEALKQGKYFDLEFLLGERVIVDSTEAFRGTVVGFELRYLVSMDRETTWRLHPATGMEPWSRTADALTKIQEKAP